MYLLRTIIRRVIMWPFLMLGILFIAPLIWVLTGQWDLCSIIHDGIWNGTADVAKEKHENLDNKT